MKKFKFLAVLTTVLTVALTFLNPTSSSAGAAFENLYNGTGDKYFNHSFRHNDTGNQICGGVYTHNMRTRLGTVTNSYVHVYNHRVTLDISSGSVNGGIATLQDTENSSNTRNSTSIFNTELEDGENYTVFWNVNMYFQPINRAIQIMQRFHPGGFDSDSGCTDADSVTFFHGSLLESTPNINSTEKVEFNSPEFSAIEKNIENSEFTLIDKSHVNSQIQASTFSRDDTLIDLMISEDKIEWVGEIHRETRGDLTIITTKNIEDVDVYTIEMQKDNQYIYLTSIISLEEILELVDL